MSLPSPRPARHAVPALPLRICRSQVVRGLVAVLPDSASPWTVAHQAPLSMGLLSQEYWSGLPFPPSGNLPRPGIKPAALASPRVGRRILYH